MTLQVSQLLAWAGLRQGRVEHPAGVPTLTAVMVLGYDGANVTAVLAVPDADVNVQQTASCAGLACIKLPMRMRVPVIPAGILWRVYAGLGETVWWQHDFGHADSGMWVDMLDLTLDASQFGTASETLAASLDPYPDGESPSGQFELELPSLYLGGPGSDAIAQGGQSRPIPGNRFPGYGNQHVVREDAPLSFDLIDTDPSAALQPTLEAIYLNDLQIYAKATGWAAGYGGSISALTANITRVVVTHTAPFTSQEVVTVRIVADCLVGSAVQGTPLDDSAWTFTVRDILAPSGVVGLALDTTTVQATFSEAVTQGTGEAGDALLLAAYRLVPITLPAITPTILSIASAGPNAVVLTCSTDLTPGATYQLTAAGVADISGNVAASLSAQFAGWMPPQPPGRRFDYLRDILPPADVAEDATGDLATFAAIIQDVLTLLLWDLDRFASIIDPDTCPAQYLDTMLAALGNPFRVVLSEIDKRHLILVLVRLYQQKGTKLGIENAVRFITGIAVTHVAVATRTWRLGVSRLGADDSLGTLSSHLNRSFDLISPVDLTDAQRATIRQVVAVMKAANEHLRFLVEP